MLTSELKALAAAGKEDPARHTDVTEMRWMIKNLVKKCLEMLAEIAELKDDDTESYEQFGKGVNSGNHEDSTVRGKIAELLRFDASASKDEQLNLKKYVDRTKGDLNDTRSPARERKAGVSSSPMASTGCYSEKSTQSGLLATCPMCLR